MAVFLGLTEECQNMVKQQNCNYISQKQLLAQRKGIEKYRQLIKSQSNQIKSLKSQCNQYLMDKQLLQKQVSLVFFCAFYRFFAENVIICNNERILVKVMKR